jgi:ubiquinone/menaquinone biosynthesis C-methylase UbiE
MKMKPRKRSGVRRAAPQSRVTPMPQPPVDKTKKPFSLSELIQKHVNLSKSRVVEIGVGPGTFGRLLGKHVKEYRGVDPQLSSVKIARESARDSTNIHYVVGKGENIPFRGKSDIVLCGFSWHYLNHPTALKEFDRVLSRNGILVILEPSNKTTNWMDPKLRDGSPEFSKKAYQQKIAAVKRAQDFLKKQTNFIIVDEFLTNQNTHIYVLKRPIHPS